MIDKLIERLDNWLSENRPDYYANLLPGLPAVHLDKFEKRFGIELPSVFHKLYAWRNGQRDNEFAAFENNRMFSCLDEIANTKVMLDEMIGIDFDDPKWWCSGWIPFLANGGGDFLCLDLTAEDHGTAGQLIAFWHDDGDRGIEFNSMEDWLELAVESMENGSIELH